MVAWGAIFLAAVKDGVKSRADTTGQRAVELLEEIRDTLREK